MTKNSLQTTENINLAFRIFAIFCIFSNVDNSSKSLRVNEILLFLESAHPARHDDMVFSGLQRNLSQCHSVIAS